MHRRTRQMCHCEERSDVAISGRQLRFRRQLPHDAARPCEIAPQGHFLALRAQGATSAFGLLAMTNRGPLPFYRYPTRIGSIAPGPAVPSPTAPRGLPDFFIVPYSPGKIHPVGKKRSLSVKSMEKRLKTGPFCDTINLYQNECTARRRGLHLHTDTTIIGGKHHECSRDHGTAQRIFL